jgi:site-specific recombinase XerD
LAYLKDGRQHTDDDHVFLAAYAPIRPLLNIATISMVVRTAIQRAGVESPSYGAHVLRHSIAADLLRRGATLDAIGALLRHRSRESTALYAKVDISALRQVAQPWPHALKEVLPC